MPRPKRDRAQGSTEQSSRSQTKASKGPEPVIPRWLHGWRGELVLLALLLLAISIFVAGYGIGMRDETFGTAWYSSLDGTPAAPLGMGSVQGGKIDDAGNTPLLVTVRGLRILASGERYVLYVLRAKQEPMRCGAFKVGAGTTRFRLTYPGLPKEPRGWLIARETQKTRGIGTILLRTK